MHDLKPGGQQALGVFDFSGSVASAEPASAAAAAAAASVYGTVRGLRGVSLKQEG